MAQVTVAEFAGIIGTDARTARKFLRSITPKENCPGKGARWAIEKRDIRSLTKKFAAFEKAENEKRAARENEKAEKAVENENNAPENENENDPTDADLEMIENEN